jgi:hypothetical protein
MSEVATEPDAGADAKGAFYCPGCGKRYDTPGNCTGKDEAGHEPIAVEKVKATSSKSSDGGRARRHARAGSARRRARAK